MIYLYQPELT